jgi:hypothetical protein
MSSQKLEISRRIFISVLTFLGISSFAFSQGLLTFEKSKLKIITSRGENIFDVELAVTERQQSQGLMFRRSMAANAGMLFDYGALKQIQMWMKNTYIPLDMIFIDSNGKVTNIVERTIPESLIIISSRGRARAVLELNSGTASRLGIKEGDRVVHSIFR